MSAWRTALLTLALWAALRVMGGDPVLDAAETDAFLGGVDLAGQLTTANAPLRERLAVGFAPHEGNAKVALLPAEQPWRHAVAEAPVARWVVALGVMLAPTAADAPNLVRASSGASLLVALALALLTIALWRRDRVAALVAPLLLLALPGVLDAARGAGAGAAGLLAMVLLVLSVERLAPSGAVVAGARPPRGALPVALAWGLTLGLHPGAAFLILPIFIAYAIARRAGAVEAPPSTPPGDLVLPSAPLTLFMLPLLGFAVLIALWPALWVETGKRLGAWLTDSWWLFDPRHDVGAVVFEQATHRAAMGWTSVAAWVAWTPLTLLAAWVAGVVRLTRRGVTGRWFALLAWLTLLLVGVADGSLWGGRLALLPLLWVPTALVAADGVAELADLWRRHGGPRLGKARLGVTAAVLALPLCTAVIGAPTSPLGGVGALLARPMPTAWLRDLAMQHPGAINVAPDGAQWAPAIEAAADGLELPLRWGGLAEASWLLVAGPVDAAVSARIAGVMPFRAGVVGGVELAVYPLVPGPSVRPAPPRR